MGSQESIVGQMGYREDIDRTSTPYIPDPPKDRQVGEYIQSGSSLPSTSNQPPVVDPWSQGPDPRTIKTLNNSFGGSNFNSSGFIDGSNREFAVSPNAMAVYNALVEGHTTYQDIGEITSLKPSQINQYIQELLNVNMVQIKK